MRQQRGFTLLELMVAMMIFAMLAVSGWQVFDSVNRARERAQLQADNLAVLQYAYLQLQQDMGQVLAYQASSTSNNNAANAANSTLNPNLNSPAGNEQNTVIPEPFMSLSAEQLKMMRYADPDPRYQTSPSIQRVEYIFSDQRLIRRQYSGTENDSVGLDTVVLEGVTEGRWQAYLPELSASFPNNDRQNNNSNALGQANNAAATESTLLPKGVSISFTYQEMPIMWQFALSAQTAPDNSQASSSGSDKSNGNNSNDNSSNGTSNNNNNSNNNDSSNDASTTNPTPP